MDGRPGTRYILGLELFPGRARVGPARTRTHSRGTHEVLWRLRFTVMAMNLVLDRLTNSRFHMHAYDPGNRGHIPGTNQVNALSPLRSCLYNYYSY